MTVLQREPEVDVAVDELPAMVSSILMPRRLARAESRLEHPAAPQELDLRTEQLAGDGPSIGHEPCRDQLGGEAVDLMDLGKDDRPLAGAALSSFMTKCARDACEPKAVDKNGKALSGAAKDSFMKKCQKEA